VAHVYTARVRVRHHEVDPFGRLTPASLLRHCAQVAIDASADAGFDAAFYAGAGGHWIIRRTAFERTGMARDEDVLTFRTWVEDFRRVRSHRCYEVQSADGMPIATARTDWVYVDLASGRPRRIPAEIEQAFGHVPGNGPARDAWSAPPPPPGAVRTAQRVRWSDLDALVHVNNAAWLDLLVEATLDVLAGLGWPAARLVAAGAMPHVVAGDLEYLDAARHGDALETLTWCAAASDGIVVHQETRRAADGVLTVRAATTWRWQHEPAFSPAAPPAELTAALAPLRAA
jgi:acyl-CoA thioesterase FadM